MMIRISTPAAADELPVGSIIADITEPDAPAVACKAARGDWQFLGGDPDRLYLSTEILPADKCRIVLLWSPEWVKPMSADRIQKLWEELAYAHKRVVNGPTSDRRTLDAYRNGLLTAYAILTGESETTIRERLIGIEASR